MVETFSTSKLGRTFGVQVNEINIRNLDTVAKDALRALLAEHQLLVIRDQFLSDAELFEFAQCFGKPMKSAFSNGIEGYPEIIEIRRRADQESALSTLWHSDSTYLPEPPHFTLLIGDEIPPFGGNTSFSDVAGAFDDLSEPLKEFLKLRNIVSCSDLHAHNDRYSHVSKPSSESGKKEVYQNIQPAVILNPDNNRHGLYANEEHTLRFEGMTVAESRPILDFLIEHIKNDKYRVEVNWTPGTIAISDNRSTQHRAVDNYFGHARKMRRVIAR